MSGNNKTYPTKLDLINALANNENERYTFAVIGPVTVTKIEQKESGTGKSYIRASIPVEHQSERLNQWFSCWYGQDETAWIPVTLWYGENGAPGVAGSFMNYLEKCGNPKSVRAVLTGKLTPNFYTDKNGNEQRGVQLAVWNVRFMNFGKSNGNDQSGNYGGGYSNGNNGDGNYGPQSYNSRPSGNNLSSGAQFFSQNNGGGQQGGYQNGGSQQSSYQNGGNRGNGGSQQGGYQNGCNRGNGGSQQGGYQNGGNRGNSGNQQGSYQNGGNRGNGGSQQSSYQNGSNRGNGGGQQGGYQNGGNRGNGGGRQGGYPQNGQQSQNPQYTAPNGNNGFGNNTGFSTIEYNDADLPF